MTPAERAADQARLLQEFERNLTPRGKMMDAETGERWNREIIQERRHFIDAMDRLGVPRVDPRLLKFGFSVSLSYGVYEPPLSSSFAYEFADIVDAIRRALVVTVESADGEGE